MTHEQRKCPRCQAVFECKPANITQCQCYGVALPPAAKAFVEERYADCLCRDCLVYFTVEVNLFREKFKL